MATTASATIVRPLSRRAADRIRREAERERGRAAMRERIARAGSVWATIPTDSDDEAW